MERISKTTRLQGLAVRQEVAATGLEEGDAALPFAGDLSSAAGSPPLTSPGPALAVGSAHPDLVWPLLLIEDPSVWSCPYGRRSSS